MKLNKELVQSIISGVAEGHSIHGSLQLLGICAFDFYRFVNADVQLVNDLESAQLVSMEKMADEIIEIADTETDSQKAKNRIDARKWIASKRSPKKYGERLDVNVNQTIDITSALLEAQNRALGILSEPREVVDLIQIANADTGEKEEKE